MCLMLLLLENGPRKSRILIVCVCMLSRFHWLQRNLVDLGFWFSQYVSMLVFQLIEMNSFYLGLPSIILCLLLLNVNPVV